MKCFGVTCPAVFLFRVVSVLGIASMILSGGAFASAATEGGEREVAAAGAPDPCLPKAGSKTSTDPTTGLLALLATENGASIPQVSSLEDGATAEAAARNYLSDCGSLFGIDDQASQLKLSSERPGPKSRRVERFQQMYGGIPVFGAELIVHVDNNDAIANVIGKVLPGIKITTRPLVSAAQARTSALAAVGEAESVSIKGLKSSEPSLWIYNPRLIGSEGSIDSLVWRVDVTPQRIAPIRYLILVDALTGGIALSFNQVDTAKYRATFTLNNGWDYGAADLECDEADGNACTGGVDPDADYAHLYAGDAYDFYYSEFGRDSIDGYGMGLYSYVHYDYGYCNAFWDGYEMTYGDNTGTTGCFIIADDVVAHELTHGITEYTSDLNYINQSGAINESMSDVFGEWIDQWNGHGDDSLPVKWLEGEDTSIGAIRNMANPPAMNDPDKMTSANYYIGTGDNGGVHTNSGVGNKAAYLITDGGTFNGYTITGIGLNKAAHIYYAAQIAWLTSSSTYLDLYNGLNGACEAWAYSNSYGITYADCAQVENATLATEMNYVAPAPGNDDFDNAQLLDPLPASPVQIYVGSATAAGDDPDGCYGGGYQSVWYKFTAAESGNEYIDTFGSTYDTVLDVWTGTRGDLTSVACSDDISGSWNSQVGFAVGAGETYYVEVTSYSDSPGVLALHAAAPTSWQGKAPIVIPRSRVAAAATNGRVYVMGGESPWTMMPVDPQGITRVSEGVVATYYETHAAAYNPATNTWTSIAPKPHGVSNVSAAVLNGKIYVPGGWRGTAVRYVEVYNPVTNTWSSARSLPQPRWAAAVAAVNGKLYMLGGADQYGNAVDWCQAYTPSTNSWKSCAPMPTARDYAAAGVVNGKIFVVGGMSAGWADLNVVEEYDPTTNSWSTRSPMSLARGGPGAVGYLDKLYVCGGGYYDYYTSCEVYDPGYDSWSEFDHLGVGRRTLALVALNGRLFAEGGFNGGYSSANERNASLPLYLATKSQGGKDGWILESGEFTNNGGTLNSTGSTFYLGDSAARQDYHAIISFNTSAIPDSATVDTVTLKVKRQGQQGDDPFVSLGDILGECNSGPFGSSSALQLGDFKAPASQPGALVISDTLAGSWYSADLEMGALTCINKTGLTQLRLGFELDDDNDALAEYLRLYSGNATSASRPQLIIKYFAP